MSMHKTQLCSLFIKYPSTWAGEMVQSGKVHVCTLDDIHFWNPHDQKKELAPPVVF